MVYIEPYIYIYIEQISVKKSTCSNSINCISDLVGIKLIKNYMIGLC